MKGKSRESWIEEKDKRSESPGETNGKKPGNVGFTLSYHFRCSLSAVSASFQHFPYHFHLSVSLRRSPGTSISERRVKPRHGGENLLKLVVVYAFKGADFLDVGATDVVELHVVGVVAVVEGDGYLVDVPF